MFPIPTQVTDGVILEFQFLFQKPVIVTAVPQLDCHKETGMFFHLATRCGKLHAIVILAYENDCELHYQLQLSARTTLVYISHILYKSLHKFTKFHTPKSESHATYFSRQHFHVWAFTSFACACFVLSFLVLYYVQQLILITQKKLWP